jgi:rhodanese-related sulfurtransferase
METAVHCAGRRGVGRRTPFGLAGRLLPAGLVLATLASAAACRSGRSEPPPFRKLRPAIAYEVLRDSPETPLLDLRPAAEFNGAHGHIKGAYNIPEERLPGRLVEIGAWRDQTFLVYCGDGRCGEEAMRVLLSSGFRDAILILGGIEAWVADGFDVVLAVEPGAAQRAADSDAPLAPPPAPTAGPEEPPPGCHTSGF